VIGVPAAESGSGVGWLVAGLAAGALATVALALWVAGLFGEATPPAAGAPRFVEETATAGVQHVYDGEFDFFVGGGVAVFDCDGDGRQDLYLAGGVNPAALYRNRSTTAGPLRFTAQVDPVTGLSEVTGAYPIDVDGDGVTDLAVLRHGENVMLRGVGDCRFERANETWGVDGGDDWTVAFSATWEDPDALPTLAFGNYLAADGQQTGRCADHVMFRPEGAIYGDRVTLTPGWCTLSILFSDWDRSGRRDLRMTNDRHYYRDGEEQLWRVDPGDPPRLWTHEEGWQPMQIWGMGIASQDLSGDGKPEVFLTSQGDNQLQQLVEGATGPEYGDIAFESGVTAHRPFVGDNVLPSTAWHAEFQDVNNDGYVDLLVTKGNVEAQPDFAAQDPSNLLLGGPDGTFVEGAEDAGILNFGRARGAALADFNLDGLLDLVVVNRREGARLWRNVGSGESAAASPMGGWVALRLEQPGANRDAIGAWVEVRARGRTIEREVTIGGGHAGGQLGWIHFGLGDAGEAEVRVRWPDGEVGTWTTVPADRFAVIERTSTEARLWEPPMGEPEE
jgi:enediyne biosynthesis protein E4